MKNKYIISIENLHLSAGALLVFSGIIAYLNASFDMALGWLVFGAMYISMSDIGENEMSLEKKNHLKHKVRRFFGYFGVLFSLLLVLFYLGLIK